MNTKQIENKINELYNNSISVNGEFIEEFIREYIEIYSTTHYKAI